jgi:membrane protease YdiL (CAAX protease family)
MGETARNWRDSGWFALLETALFVAVFLAGTYNYLPISHTPYLLILAWVMLAIRGKRWRDVGFTWPPHGSSAIVLGLIAGVALAAHELIVIEPVVRSLTGTSPDLSQFADLRGNLQLTLFWIGLSWLLAGFGEEMVWRGYALTRVAEVSGGTASAWLLSLIAVSAAFGVAHDYQELSGMIITGIGGALYAVLYLLAGRNLVVPIMAHGAQNTCDFALIYAGRLPGA